MLGDVLEGGMVRGEGGNVCVIMLICVVEW